MVMKNRQVYNTKTYVDFEVSTVTEEEAIKIIGIWDAWYLDLSRLAKRRFDKLTDEQQLAILMGVLASRWSLAPCLLKWNGVASLSATG